MSEPEKIKPVSPDTIQPSTDKKTIREIITANERQTELDESKAHVVEPPKARLVPVPPKKEGGK